MTGSALMAAGGALMALMPTWAGQLGGRLMVGIGGVLLNVCMTKMVTDWFAGKEIATAMAIFANAWPGGIALALMVLPPIGAQAGLSVALLAAAGYALAAMVLLPAALWLGRSWVETVLLIASVVLVLEKVVLLWVVRFAMLNMLVYVRSLVTKS